MEWGAHTVVRQVFDFPLSYLDVRAHCGCFFAGWLDDQPASRAGCGTPVRRENQHGRHPSKFEGCGTIDENSITEQLKFMV
jgi:hypothetical protein